MRSPSAAATEDGCLAEYSFYRKHTDLVAPGGGVPRPAASRPKCANDTIPILQLTYSCFPANCAGGHQRFAIRPDVGTSMSAAHATGVAALVIASGVAGADPAPKNVARRLQCTARPASPKRFYGPGLLDAKRAVDPAPPLRRRQLGDRRLGRARDVDAAGSVVGDLVRHAAEQEAPGAGHALVADHDQVRVDLLGDVEDGVGGIALAGVGA